MLEKVILGLLVGMLAGSSASALRLARFSASDRPFNMQWLEVSTSIMSLFYLGFIGFTFYDYGIKYGFMAIGEVFAGAFIAGFFNSELRLNIAMLSVPLTTAAFIFLW